jgi:Coenzyme PQQ synthesis protein D (PqqD)
MVDLITASRFNAVFFGEDSYLLYNLESQKLHRLSATAALILELCNGDQSATEICEGLAPALADNADTLQQWISFALDEGLLKSTARVLAETRIPVEKKVFFYGEKAKG